MWQIETRPGGYGNYLCILRIKEGQRRSSLRFISAGHSAAQPKHMKRTVLSLLCISALTLAAYAEDKESAARTAVDNTAKNERDASGATKTSGDQSESAEDIKITAAIRRAIVADDSLTMTATNVKIITADGKVTLRGPVKTAAEKAKIAQLAEKEAGKATIDNQLEVKESK